MSDPVLLVGDIGGTNARFALADPNSTGYRHDQNFQCRDFPQIIPALQEYLGRVGVAQPDAICLAAAGPVEDDRIQLTNNHWVIETEALRSAFGPVPVQLLNDFEAVAHSLPLLGGRDLVAIGHAVPDLGSGDDYRVAVLGPGTGLGVAGLVSQGGRLTLIVGEGGHVGFSPATTDQLRVHQALMQKLGHVFNEALISGPGLENVYAVLSDTGLSAPASLGAQDIFELAQAKSDSAAQAAVTVFFEGLGQIAGDVALQLGAFDGVFIAGGIVRRYPQLLQQSRFRAGFENKGVYQSLMERMPTALVVHPDPGLLGASQRVRELLT